VTEDLIARIFSSTGPKASNQGSFRGELHGASIVSLWRVDGSVGCIEIPPNFEDFEAFRRFVEDHHVFSERHSPNVAW